MDKNKKKWTPKITLSLVHLYELQPVLYKTDCAGYHNSFMRHKALESIKNELETIYKLEFCIEDISKKINNVRSQYLEINKKFKKVLPSGSAAPDTKPSWWLYEHLSFLLGYIGRDKAISSMMTDTTPIELFEEEYLINDSPRPEMILFEENINNESGTSADDLLSPQSTRPASVASMSGDSSVDPLGNEKKKRKKNEKSNVDETMIQAIQKIIEEKTAVDDIKSFTNYMETELREIKSKELFKKCKREVLAVIMKFQDEDVLLL